ncbi:MAG: peptidoglycan-binding protein [Pseudomonadota bacterium]
MASRVADDSAQPTDPSATESGSKAGKPTTGEAAQAKPAKTRRRKPSPSKTATSQSVQADLDALEARLKQADMVTQRSIASLETVVTALEATLKKSTATQKGRLTRHVNELTERLDTQGVRMRAAVRKELRTALAEGGLENIDAAVGRAASRLDEAEVAQADAIARINKHLADIARAVDARMKAESKSRREEIDALTAKLTADIATSRTALEQRVGTIERDSSQALEKVGDTIEKIHARMEQRRQASNDVVVEKVNELALQTQAELDAHEARLEARFKAQIQEVEARHIAVGTGAAERVAEKVRNDIDLTIDALQTRITELEEKTQKVSKESARKGTDTLSETRTAPSVALAPLPPLPDAPTQTPAQAPANPEPVPQAGLAAHGGPVQVLRDRIGIRRAPAAAPQSSPSDNPYADALSPSNDSATTPATAYGGNPVVPFPGQPGSPLPPLPPFQMPAGLTDGSGQPLDDDFHPAPVPDAVYSNPAYAEGADGRGAGMTAGSPMAVRVADDTPARRLALPGALSGALPTLTGRNVRVALLATGVAVIGLMAGRMILGTSDITDPNVTGGGNGQPVVTTQPVQPQNGYQNGYQDSFQNPAQPVGQPATQPGFQTPAPLGAPSDPGAGSLPLTALGGDAPNQGTTLPSTVSQLPPSGPAPRTQTPAQAQANAPIGAVPEQQPVRIDAAALETLDAAVAAGNPVAQFQKGLAELEAGETDAGASLIRQAANGGQPAALYRLAKLYETGEGVPRDDVMARQLIERAARGGNRIAMHDLALYYTEGRGGVELDMATAKSWFEQAANRGVVDSQFNLAILSESTESGETPDLANALFWYSVAARQGDQFAVSRRDALRGAVSAEQLDAIDARVERFAPQAIDKPANGIFEGLPWMGDPAPADQAQVRQAQTLLASLGYPVGTPDGVMGSRTRSAIVQFERANGLSETGQVSGVLLDRLSRAAGA